MEETNSKKTKNLCAYYVLFALLVLAIAQFAIYKTGGALIKKQPQNTVVKDIYRSLDSQKIDILNKRLEYARIMHQNDSVKLLSRDTILMIDNTTKTNLNEIKNHSSEYYWNIRYNDSIISECRAFEAKHK